MNWSISPFMTPWMLKAETLMRWVGNAALWKIVGAEFFRIARRYQPANGVRLPEPAVAFQVRFHTGGAQYAHGAQAVCSWERSS